MLRDKVVLIVDDEAQLREILTELFRLDEAKVIEAENGVDALAKVMSGAVDVVITDARMPGGDGIALIRALAELATPKPMVFLCSAFNDLSEVEALELGVRERFAKPFDILQMRESVVRHLSRAG